MMNWTIDVHHRMMTESMNEWQIIQLSMLCPDDYIFGGVHPYIKGTFSQIYPH